MHWKYQLYIKNISKVLFDSIFYLRSKLFTPEVLIAIGIKVLKTTQAITVFTTLITNLSHLAGDKITVTLFSVKYLWAILSICNECLKNGVTKFLILRNITLFYRKLKNTVPKSNWAGSNNRHFCLIFKN